MGKFIKRMCMFAGTIGVLLTLFGCGKKEMTAIKLAEKMGNGINLSNTFEAYGRSELGTDKAPIAYETFWGQPPTTKEIILAMKKSGFDTIRIPVAWTNTMQFETQDYTISEAYLERVKEVIDYAIEEDMYVIVNDHWDGSWWGMFGSANEETRQQARELYTAMWSQIAKYYKDYDEHLIFESANEELGDRLNDIDVAADSGSLSEEECYQTTNEINQMFVDLIRKSGGKNKNRFLLIAGYNTDVQKTVDERFVMPTDSAKEKLLLSVHYYTPWGYCGNSSLSKWGTKRHVGEMNSLLESLSKFPESGVPVVIGEYAVSPRADGSVKENTYDYLHNFLNNCDYYGYVPVLWDTGAFFSRRETLGFWDETMRSVYSEYAYATQKDTPLELLKENAKSQMDAFYEQAPDSLEEDTVQLDASKAMAWIMFNSGDWYQMYSVGDVYDPEAKTEGLVTTDVEVTGEGTYTVGLDFTKTGPAKGTAFSALAIANGETLFPGYIIDIKEVLVNGEPYKLCGVPYTSSDDGICTRVNLYNEWISEVPDDIRTMHGQDGVTPMLLSNDTLGEINTLQITFEYVKGE